MKILCCGSDPNLLTAAICLKQAGHEVVIVQGEVWGGFTNTIGNAPFDPVVAKELKLSIPEPTPGRTGLSPEGEEISFTDTTLNGATQADLEAWPNFVKTISQGAEFLRSLQRESPSGDIIDRWRSLGRRQAMEVLRCPWQSLKDLLDEWFETELLKATLAAAALRGSRQGPFASGTGFLLLQRWSRGEITTTADSPLESLRVAVTAAGIPVIDDQVESFETRRGKIESLLTRDGVEMSADLFLTDEDPKTTLERRVGLQMLSPDTQHDLRGWDCRSTTGTAVLDTAKTSTTRAMTLCSSVDDLERAYDPTKYGQNSQAPFAELDAFTGRLLVQHVGGQDAAESMAHLAERYGLGSISTEMGPEQLELLLDRETGHLFGGEVTLWQSSRLRERFSNPISNLHLCGASSGPGDYSGLAGWNCAHRILL